MARRVRIVGDEDEWLVIGESDTSMTLVNLAAQRRRDLAVLDRQIAALQAFRDQLQASPAVVDVSAPSLERP